MQRTHFRWSVVAAVVSITLFAVGGTFLLAYWLTYRPTVSVPDEPLQLVILVPDIGNGKSGIAYFVEDKVLVDDLDRQLKHPTSESRSGISEALIGRVYFQFGSTSRGAALTSSWTTLSDDRGLHSIDLRRVREHLIRDHKGPDWFFQEPVTRD